MVQFQSAVKAFIRHHSLDIDPDEIPVSATASGSQAVDEWDMCDNSVRAVGPVQTWLEYHPSGEPDDYLLTARVDDNNKATPGRMLAQQTIRGRLKKTADEADITKPVHPHNVRHSFVKI